VLPSASIGG